MKKLIIAGVLIVVLALIFFGRGKGAKEEKLTGTGESGESVKTETATNKNEDIKKVCDFFPKELVEKALGKPIVKVEEGTLVDPTCNYYTSYSDKYEHTPYADRPGGPHIVVVYDTKDFAKDRVSNEKSGTKYETDPSIAMSNFVMKNNINKIWQVALDYGGEKYIRIKSIDEAATGEELVKIGAAFASK